MVTAEGPLSQHLLYSTSDPGFLLDLRNNLYSQLFVGVLPVEQTLAALTIF